MKIKHFLAALAAVFTLGFTVSCDESNDPTLLDEVQVSSSYVALPATGDSNNTVTAKITVTATESWNITGMPDWLTVSPASGGAGTTEVSFIAKPYEGRTAEVFLTCGINTQRINVIQGIAQIDNATVAQINAGPDSKTYRVTGVVTKITETATYGNWYLNDGTVDGDGLYIYGTKYQGQTKQAALIKLGIEVGDEVTIEGPKTTYNGTVELVDVDVIKVNKSLIKVDSTMVAGKVATELPSDGGQIEAFLTNKGNGLFVDVPADAKDWLSIASVAGNKVTFNVAANTAGPRTTTLVFKTTDGKKDYTAETTISQAGLSGTLELPMTVAEAIAAANAGITTPVYVKGIVSKLVDSKNKSNEYVPGFNSDYGNGSFWISADGKYNEDLALDFEVYQANWLGGKSWTEENPQIAVGAEVVIYGPLTLYKGTAETQGKGAAYVYSVNGATADENGIGTLEAPFNVAGAYAAANAGVTSNVYVSGIASKVLYTFSASYGTGTFWLSDDGTYNGAADGKSTTDYTHDFEAYSVYWFNNTPWAEGNAQVEVGDKVTVLGAITIYKNMVETSSKKAWVYSLNGATE